MHDPHPGALMPLHRLEVPAPRTLPFAIGSFDTIGPEARAGYPHRHTFHEVVLVTGGRGGHVLDLCRRALAPPQLVVIAPGRVHHWDDVRDLQGVVVLFDDAFLLDRPADRELLGRLGSHPMLDLPPATAAGSVDLLTAMRREYRERRPGAGSVLQAYLHVLLVTAARIAPAPARASHGGARAALARRFVQRLAHTPGGPGEVRAWAAELGVSAGYLGEVVRETTGRSPGPLIREARVLEAKRLLAGTGMTVSGVARQVGFPDAAYFCRFFRRETGASPGEFRREAKRDSTLPMDHGHRFPSIDPPHGAP